MQNPVEYLGYIKCYIMSSPITNKSPRNSIRYKTWNRTGNQRKGHYLIIYTFFKGLTNHRKKTDKAVAFTSRSLPNALKYKDPKLDLPAIW